MSPASRLEAGPLPRLERRWRARAAAPSQESAESLRSLNLPAPLCGVLASRGLDARSATDFLKPRIDALHDPMLMRGMPAAVERVERAIGSGETILVHGDYDVDGMCASALLTRVLRALGGTVEPFVPHRMRDGYDFGAAGVEAARRAGAGLILTADCGVVAHEAVRQARAHGADVVITDHHAPGESLPDAVAVLNPSRDDCTYPGGALCGAGVAFKLCEALWARAQREREELLYHLDLVAVATIADLVPLGGENRVLARFGLRVLARTRNPGLRTLMRVAGVDPGRLRAGQVSHVLAPRLNAVGRLGDAAVGVRLLLAEDEIAAAPLAQQLDAYNRERRELDRETLEQALALLEDSYEPAAHAGVVLAREGWHPGVIGIVASRVVERIGRPTVLIALRPDGGPARGSGRSVRGFDLHAALAACAPHLERFGGHRAAAGLDIRPDAVAAFREAFDAHARARLGPEGPVGEVAYDVQLELAAATHEVARLLRHFEPFGIGNPTPTFVARGVRVTQQPRVVGSNHLRMVLEQGGARLQAIGFGMADRPDAADVFRAPFDVAFQLQLDEWNGRSRVQAKLVDVRPAA